MWTECCLTALSLNRTPLTPADTPPHLLNPLNSIVRDAAEAAPCEFQATGMRPFDLGISLTRTGASGTSPGKGHSSGDAPMDPASGVKRFDAVFAHGLVGTKNSNDRPNFPRKRLRSG